MGTPRLLASVDQIRKAQRTARAGGDCPPTVALESGNSWPAISGLGRTMTGNATDAALTSQLESAFASGCAGVDLCSPEVAQQVLLAQEPGLHACCSGALDRMHDLAARLTGVVKSAAAIAVEVMILLNIDSRIAQVRPRVEKSVQHAGGVTAEPSFLACIFV